MTSETETSITARMAEARKFQLQDSWRVDIISEHRHILSQDNEGDDNNSKLHERMEHEILVEKSAFDPKQLKDFKPIVLIQMDYAQDQIYTGRIIELRSIEPVAMKDRCISLIVEDKDGDSQKCLIRNYEYDKDTVDEIFGFGCKFSIANPNLRTSTSETSDFPYISVDDPGTIILFPKDRLSTMCRYCGTEKAEKHCSKCKRAYYCDRECQMNDWRLYKHKRICEAKS